MQCPPAFTSGHQCQPRKGGRAPPKREDRENPSKDSQGPQEPNAPNTSAPQLPRPGERPAEPSPSKQAGTLLSKLTAHGKQDTPTPDKVHLDARLSDLLPALSAHCLSRPTAPAGVTVPWRHCPRPPSIREVQGGQSTQQQGISSAKGKHEPSRRVAGRWVVQTLSLACLLLGERPLLPARRRGEVGGPGQCHLSEDERGDPQPPRCPR